VCSVDKHGCPFAKWREKFGRLLDLPRKGGFNPCLPVQGNESALAAGGILAGCLAHGGSIGGQVEEVVGELKGKTYFFAECG
jgi:hypothetical protein